MPRGDGTGPGAMGPMTGRGAGYCAGSGMPGYMNRGPAAAVRSGWGGGAGRRFAAGRCMGGGGAGRWAGPYARTAPIAPPAPYAPPAPQQELGALREQAKYLEEMLAGLRGRVSELEGGQA